MIARIRLAFNGKHQYAAMTDAGRWLCSDAMTKEMLNALYSVDHERRGPADGSMGVKEVEEVVARYGGKILWLKEPKGDGKEKVY